MKKLFAIVLAMSILLTNTVYAEDGQGSITEIVEATSVLPGVSESVEGSENASTTELNVTEATGEVVEGVVTDVTEVTPTATTEEKVTEVTIGNVIEVTEVTEVVEQDFPTMNESEDFTYFENFVTDSEYVTRGEVATMLTRLFNYSAMSVNYFNDLDDKFYKEPLLKLAAADIMVGDGNMMRPMDNISYEEMCTILYKVLHIQQNTDVVIHGYLSNVSPWASDIVNSVAAGGYVDVEKYHNIDATEKITYEDFKYMISYALPVYYEKSSTVVGQTINQNILITSNDVTFENSTLGNVYYTHDVNIDTIKFINTTVGELVKIRDGGNAHQYEPYDFILSEFTTTFDEANTNRNINLKLSLDGIDNEVLEPNEQFSFNETLGERTYAKGYKDSIVIYANTQGYGIAGGICQTSTTVYNAAVYSGLKIDERYSHTLKVPYVEPGHDAMVNYGTNDLKFTNSYNVPVKIDTVYDPTGEMTVSIASQGYVDVPKVEVAVEGGPKSYISTVTKDGEVEFVTKSWYFK